MSTAHHQASVRRGLALAAALALSVTACTSGGDDERTATGPDTAPSLVGTAPDSGGSDVSTGTAVTGLADPTVPAGSGTSAEGTGGGGDGASGGGPTSSAPPATDDYRSPTPSKVAAEPVAGADLGPDPGGPPEVLEPALIAVSSAAPLIETRALSVGGDRVASVAVLAVGDQSATSERFRDQFLVQVVTEVVGVAEPRFVEAGGHRFAEGRGTTSAVVAWFEGSEVMVLVPTDLSSDTIELAVTAAGLTGG